jgi:murein DD-endopeptidase MepM/ murein hydrolase activator NlpD
MIRRHALALLAVLLLASPVRSEEVTHRLGRLVIAVDESSAFPGGLIAVHVKSAPRLGVVHAMLDGGSYPFLSARRGLRALVPVRVDAPPGPTTLGIEVRGAGGRQRFAFQVTVAERTYPARSVVLPDVKKAMLTLPAGVRDGRVVQLYLRTVTPKQGWQGPFHSPVAAEPETSFGGAQSYDAPPPVEAKMDAIWGEYHRGLDYPVPAGTAVSAPAAGSVLFAGPLLLTGETVVLDHGQGVISVFYHLASTPLRGGDWVEGGAPVGLSGETGIAAVPHLHWGVYVHGVAVDPRITQTFAD